MTEPTRVFVTQLMLTDFRNHPHLTVAADRRIVVLAGENGAGKTNVLEAVSMMSPGRGLRRAAHRELSRIGGGGGWAVSGVVEGPWGCVRIGTGLQPGDAARNVRIDGEPQKSADVLTEHLRVMWLTPAMDGLFTGPASDRRRFLDRMVLSLDPAHGRRAAATATPSSAICASTASSQPGSGRISSRMRLRWGCARPGGRLPRCADRPVRRA